MENVGFVSTGAAGAVGGAVTATVWASCPIDCKEIVMAETATRIFRNIVKILSVKEGYSKSC